MLMRKRKRVNTYINELIYDYEFCADEIKRIKSEKDKQYGSAYNKGYVYGYLQALIYINQITKEQVQKVGLDLNLNLEKHLVF